MTKTFQHLRYENKGLKLFESARKLILEKAYLMVALDQQKERIATGGMGPDGWKNEDSLITIDRVLQGLRRGDYEMVIPSLAEKEKIKEDGIGLYKLVVEIIVWALIEAAASCQVSGHRWTMLATSLEKGIIEIVRTN